MELTPIGNRVLVEIQQKAEEGTGFVLPEESDRYEKAKILALGNGAFLRSGSTETLEKVKVGDLVLVEKGYGTEIGDEMTDTENRVKLVKDQEILMVVGEK